MPVSTTGKIERVEVITSVQRRRRWSAEEKTRVVQEMYAPGMSVSRVASTASEPNVHGRDLVKPVSRAQRGDAKHLA
jgi:hypothetical protein